MEQLEDHTTQVEGYEEVLHREDLMGYLMEEPKTEVKGYSIEGK